MWFNVSASFDAKSMNPRCCYCSIYALKKDTFAPLAPLTPLAPPFSGVPGPGMPENARRVSLHARELGIKNTSSEKSLYTISLNVLIFWLHINYLLKSNKMLGICR